MFSFLHTLYRPKRCAAHTRGRVGTGFLDLTGSQNTIQNPGESFLKSHFFVGVFSYHLAPERKERNPRTRVEETVSQASHTHSGSLNRPLRVTVPVLQELKKAL